MPIVLELLRAYLEIDVELKVVEPPGNLIEERSDGAVLSGTLRDSALISLRASEIR